MAEYIEQITWHEVTCRALTDEEKAEYAKRGYADYEVPEYIFDCEMPDDGDEILIATRCGVDKDMIDKALKYIKTIVTDFEEGMILEGTVVSIKEFGAFVEFAPGKEGMVHISKIAKERVEHVEDYLTLGDKVKVKCLGKDKMGRMSFSIKDAK